MKSGQPLLTAGVTALAPAIWGSTYLVTPELVTAGPPAAGHHRADASRGPDPAGLHPHAADRNMAVARPGARNAQHPRVQLPDVRRGLSPTGWYRSNAMAVQPMIVLILAALLLGVASALAAAVCLAAGITLTKLWRRPDGVGLLPSTGWQPTAGGLVSLPFTLCLEGLPTTINGTKIIGFAYLISLGAVISYAIWFRGIARLPVLAVSFLAFGSPIVATLLRHLLLHQTLSILQLVGILVIISGALLAQPRPVKPRGLDPHDPPNSDNPAVLELKPIMDREGRR